MQVVRALRAPAAFTSPESAKRTAARMQEVVHRNGSPEEARALPTREQLNAMLRERSVRLKIRPNLHNGICALEHAAPQILGKFYPLQFCGVRKTHMLEIALRITLEP